MISWQRDLDDPFLFHGSALGQNHSLRIGDFPDEPMFTLMTEGRVRGQFDDRPSGCDCQAGPTERPCVPFARWWPPLPALGNHGGPLISGMSSSRR